MSEDCCRVCYRLFSVLCRSKFFCPTESVEEKCQRFYKQILKHKPFVFSVKSIAILKINANNKKRDQAPQYHLDSIIHSSSGFALFLSIAIIAISMASRASGLPPLTAAGARTLFSGLAPNPTDETFEIET